MTFPFSNRFTPFMPSSESVDTVNEKLLRSYAKTGDAEAFAELVRQLAPMVLGVCKPAIADHQLAEDAVQAAFRVIYCSLTGRRRLAALRCIQTQQASTIGINRIEAA